MHRLPGRALAAAVIAAVALAPSAALAWDKVKIPEGTELPMRLEETISSKHATEGDRFTVSFNGKPLYTITDRTFDTAGKIALWTKADSVTRFDRLEISAMPK